MNLKNVFGQIDADDGSLSHGRLPRSGLTTPLPWHKDAVGARPPHRLRLIGVVLTGYLDDGAAGLQAIKQGGGLTVVQDPKEAEAPSMPLNALRAVLADYCLPLREIGPLLASLAASPNLKKESMVKEEEPRYIM
jgi:hypothetical protein